ncbi:hypothetical protein [Pedobacter terrae]|uniref:hypothetical protein n=1 Tax=Pedobacter terrae TaxID=405671 RepID=UPI002FFB6FFC
MKKILVLVLFVAAMSGCSSMKSGEKASMFTISGTIEKLGMTTFQYGTHLLKADSKTYALKSETINLDSYLNKKVRIEGKKVAGYPVDGGPELVDVTLVKF